MSRNVASATPRGASRRAVRAVLPLATVLLAAAMLAGCEPSRSGGGVYAGVALSATAINTSEGGPNVEFTVALNTAPTASVAVDLVVTGDEGYLRGPGSAYDSSWATLTFTATNWNTPQVVAVVPRNDTTTDGDQTYTITVSVGATTDTVYLTIPDRTISVINADDDIPGFTVSKTQATTQETPTQDTFTVRLNKQPTAAVTIPVTSSDISEGLVGTSVTEKLATLSLSFTTTNWSTAQTVYVHGVSDAVDDGNQTYAVTVGRTVGRLRVRGAPLEVRLRHQRGRRHRRDHGGGRRADARHVGERDDCDLHGEAEHRAGVQRDGASDEREPRRGAALERRPERARDGQPHLHEGRLERGADRHDHRPGRGRHAGPERQRRVRRHRGEGDGRRALRVAGRAGRPRPQHGQRYGRRHRPGRGGHAAPDARDRDADRDLHGRDQQAPGGRPPGSDHRQRRHRGARAGRRVPRDPARDAQRALHRGQLAGHPDRDRHRPARHDRGRQPALLDHGGRPHG